MLGGGAQSRGVARLRGGRDVGLAAQVPYWSEDVVASGGLLRGKGPQLEVRALVQLDDVAIHFACAVLHYDEQ